MPLFFWEADASLHRADIGDGEVLELETLSPDPRVFLAARFASPEECNVIRQLASDDSAMVASSVGIRGIKTPLAQRSSQRRSQSRKLGLKFGVASSSYPRSPVAEALQRRAAALARSSIGHVEPLEIVRYDHSNYYGAHTDYTELYGSKRVATLTVYCTDSTSTLEGGAINFPLANSTRSEAPDWQQSCHDGSGLAVSPEEGNALLWYNTIWDQSGELTMDSRTLHTGCPVLRGCKVIANVWIHEKELGALFGPDGRLSH